MARDLHSLPKLRDSLSYIYIEHAVIEKDHYSVVSITKNGRTPIPIAAMTTLLLGPGTSITHDAIKNIVDCGCTVVWCGENDMKFYASGHGETRSASNLLKQAEMCMDPKLHLRVVRRMYELRFGNTHLDNTTLQQLRGMEGARVRDTYRQMAERYGVEWRGRNYKSTSWDDSDDINKAISYGNSLLYALCESAIVSLGYSPGLGFIHTGKLLSFVYDIADLYKLDTVIPVAFSVLSSEHTSLYSYVRTECRKQFVKNKILSRIPEDIADIFEMPHDEDTNEIEQVSRLWTDDGSVISGGVSHFCDEEQ